MIKMRLWRIVYRTDFFENEPPCILKEYVFTDQHCLERVKALQALNIKILGVDKLPYTIKNFYLCCKGELTIEQEPQIIKGV